VRRTTIERRIPGTAWQEQMALVRLWNAWRIYAVKVSCAHVAVVERHDRRDDRREQPGPSSAARAAGGAVTTKSVKAKPLAAADRVAPNTRSAVARQCAKTGPNTWTRWHQPDSRYDADLDVLDTLVRLFPRSCSFTHQRSAVRYRPCPLDAASVGRAGFRLGAVWRRELEMASG
jgi:hypothetical protein